MTPEHPESLFRAYLEVTGYELSLSESRKHTLSECFSRGITAEQVTAVCKELKRLLDRGTKGYTEQSLAFRNVFVPDTLEERCAVLKQRAKRLQPPKPDVPHTRQVGENVVAFLAPPEPDDNVPLADVRQGLSTLTKNILAS